MVSLMRLFISQPLTTTAPLLCFLKAELLKEQYGLPLWVRSDEVWLATEGED